MCDQKFDSYTSVTLLWKTELFTQTGQMTTL